MDFKEVPRASLDPTATSASTTLTFAVPIASTSPTATIASTALDPTATPTAFPAIALDPTAAPTTNSALLPSYPPLTALATTASAALYCQLCQL